MQLNRDMVVMGAKAASKDEALVLVAKALEEKGLVADYVGALKEREAQTSTYLGAGLAIPHGTKTHAQKVQKTGVVLLHFANGVNWGDDNLVYLAVGIAANSDEHLVILRNLAKCLGDDNLLDKLKTANTADDILSALGQSQTANSKTVHTQVINDALVSDSEQMLFLAVNALKSAYVEEGFLADILSKPLILLNQGVFCVQSNVAVKAPAVVAVLPKTTITHKGQSLQALMVIADDKSSGSEKFFDGLIDGILGFEQPTYQQFLTLFNQKDMGNYATAQVFLANRHGLHARPATALSQLASQFAGEVLVAGDGEFVSAKSLVRLLSLGATYGQALTFKVQNDNGQGESFVATLVEAVNAGLGEEVVPIYQKITTQEPFVVSDETAIGEPLVRNQKLSGIVASSGICVGNAFVVKQKHFDIRRESKGVKEERALLDNAVQVVLDNLELVVKNARTTEIADIFNAHKSILQDQEMLSAVYARIEEGLSAPMAWHSEIEAIAKVQGGLDNPLLAQRAADLKDIGTRVLAVLCGEHHEAPEGSHILVKEEILPSDVATLGDNVLGIITASGGASSHSAIIARSLGIPALVGAGACVLEIETGERVLVDGEMGYFVASPDDEFTKASLLSRELLRQKKDKARENCHLPAITLDNHQMEVAVNLGDISQVMQAVTAGAEGVGLLRTEFVFMKHNKMPDEETQIADYTQVFDAMDGKPVVVRTLDVGGDKPLPYLTMKKEENPFLGVRGIRLSLQRPELLECQLISLIKASKNRPLAIMFPMVGQLDEWYKAKSILDKVLKTYPHDNLQVGIMVEVPSTAILADKFAPEVDFFSIGTNDLTQYALAIDRGHPMLSASADGLDPSVLRLIEMTVKAAHTHGKWVGVCGELGSDNLAVPVLLGLGVDELSVSAGQIPLVKAQIRELSFAECQALAEQALNAESGQAVRALVKAQAEQ